jgi:hypothetical protein
MNPTTIDFNNHKKIPKTTFQPERLSLLGSRTTYNISVIKLHNSDFSSFENIFLSKNVLY